MSKAGSTALVQGSAELYFAIPMPHEDCHQEDHDEAHEHAAEQANQAQPHGPRGLASTPTVGLTRSGWALVALNVDASGASELACEPLPGHE
mmetsp:Transcript_122679/g.212714  ORF Transcript_122679/g.212714 Transcript_122679/m.212714 type:complete len:92 (+) Transcript_122679:837-1112(+)